MLGTRSMCHCRLPIGGDACYHVGQSSERRPMLSTVLDWLKAQKQTNLRVLLGEHTSSEEGKLILQNWQNLQFIRGLVPMLKAQRQNWRSPALHGPQGTLGCHSQWVLLRCRSSGAWLYLVFLVEMLLMARNDQPGAEVHKVLYALLAPWVQFVQSAPTSDCVHHSNGSLSQNMSWHTWPPIRLQRPLSSFCTRVTSQSLELHPGS